MAESAPKMAMVAARARNGVIGNANRLPWHLPRDFAWFKKVTMGKPLIMGRKTFDSIGRPLPGRYNIVVTRNADWHAPGVSCAPDLEHAIALASDKAREDACEEFCVLGGETIYRQALARCDRLYLTEVAAEPEGDAFFPAIDSEQWQLRWQEKHLRDESHLFDFSFIVLERVNNANNND